ncbi:MAG: FkbM family methyltransferase [Thermoleophilaceae bacterium]
MVDLRLRASKVLWALSKSESRRALLVHRVLAASEHRRAPFEKTYGTVIDVGAHHGQFALFAAQRFPGADILCFEPQPEALAQLRRTATSMLDRLTIFPYAAGAEPARVDMHISARDDSSSLLPISERGQAAAFPGTQETGTITVEVRSLDEMLSPARLTPPVLLKIDVQGSELEVLRGANRTLDHVDDVLVEASFRELYAGQPLVSSVLAELFACDYALVDVCVSHRDRRGPVQADLLLRRGSSSAHE